MVAQITLGDALPILGMIFTMFGGAKVIEILITKLIGKREARRKDERDENADERAEIEQWQQNSSRWQGEAMTLQGELKKRDDVIAQMQLDIQNLRQALIELKGEMADVLSENRRYRIQLDLRGNGVSTGKAD